MKTLPLLILFLAVLVNQSLTQTNTVINSLEKVTTERLPIPRDLPMLGAKTYQFSKTAARQIEIKFFNGQNEQIATSTLSENVMDSSVTVTLAESSGQDWIKISLCSVSLR